MAKTWQNALDEARAILQDTAEPQRVTDTIMLAKLNRALQELGRLRPDAFFTRFDEDSGEVIIPEVQSTDADPVTDEDTDDVANLPVDTVEALADNVSVPMQFYTALVYFVVASCEILDDEYATDSRAAMMLTQFRQQVISL